MSTIETAAVAADRMLRLSHVSHSFVARKDHFDAGEHHVLNDVSFDLYRGEVLGVIGKNGVGKTTLLRLMAGILAPRSGSIEMRPGTRCALLSLGLGFQGQLTGRDNARLASILQGSSAKAAESALQQIQDFSELGASFDEPVKTYSAGMRARLGFATSILTHDDILLIDEVLAVGDADFRKKAARAMREKIAGDQTVVLVSHAAAQVKTLCDRAILLDGGSLVMDGSTGEVLDAYSGRR